MKTKKPIAPHIAKAIQATAVLMHAADKALWNLQSMYGSRIGAAALAAEANMDKQDTDVSGLIDLAKKWTEENL